MAETVRSEIEIAAPQATVFAFLTDPDKIMRWLASKATVEPHPGGIYLVDVGGRNVARGEFTEVIPVHRLAYSFGWEDRENVPPGSTLIEIDLVEKGNGTLLRLTHSGLPDETERASHAKGWNHYIRRLAIAAAGGDPGPDTLVSKDAT
ncbi:SRPBCC domain-containing protein [Rhizobiaceae sp. 2RAB30]